MTQLASSREYSLQIFCSKSVLTRSRPCPKNDGESVQENRPAKKRSRRNAFGLAARISGGSHACKGIHTYKREMNCPERKSSRRQFKLYFHSTELTMRGFRSIIWLRQCQQQFCPYPLMISWIPLLILLKSSPNAAKYTFPGSVMQ